MRVRLHWTRSRLDHIDRHHVTRAEVEAALADRLYWRRSGKRVLAIGRARGRFLFVVLEPSAARPDLAEVVTCRNATKAEKRLFARRGKRP